MNKNELKLVATAQNNSGCGVIVYFYANFENTDFRVDYNHDGYISETRSFTDVNQAIDYFNALSRIEIYEHIGITSDDKEYQA